MLKIDLSLNECLIAPSRPVISAATRAIRNVNLYPQQKDFDRLKCQLANINKISSSQIAIGSGSSELIQIIMRSFLSSEETIVIGKYSFLLYKKISCIIGNRMIEIETNNLIDQILKLNDTAIKLIILVNPNNVTGEILNPQDIEYIVKNTLDKNIFVIVDEAYHEYMSSFSLYQSFLKKINDYPNLIILRTLSKAYGLAGLRIGYAVSHENTIKRIENFIVPFNVNSIALAAANAALKDKTHLNKILKLTEEGLKILQLGIEDIGFSCLPPSANFVTFKMKTHAKNLYSHFMKHNINIRWLKDYGLEHFFRVTVGVENDIHTFLKFLKLAKEKSIIV